MEESVQFETDGGSVTVEVTVESGVSTSTQRQTISVPSDGATVTVNVSDED